VEAVLLVPTVVRARFSAASIRVATLACLYLLVHSTCSYFLEPQIDLVAVAECCCSPIRSADTMTVTCFSTKVQACRVS
jgi:hypothetical protein